MSRVLQKHIYKSFNNGTNSTITQQIPVSCSFPVKRIRFDFAYVITSTYITNFLVSVDMPTVHGEPCGVLNAFSAVIGGNYYYQDGFSQDKVIEYVFADPQKIDGELNLTFNDLNQSFNNILTSSVVVHIECLSE